MSIQSLFQPFTFKSLQLKNRFVMAPMTRSFSPGGVPTDKVAAYYERRALGEVGLIISEGTVIDRAASTNDPSVPHFHGEAALKGWKKVIDDVHAVGGKMAPQLWHVGITSPHRSGWLPETAFEGPSGYAVQDKVAGIAMSEADIVDTINAYASAARDAKRLGFDAAELHGAHGYLIDQFFWPAVNKRSDRFGGNTIAQRTRFAVELVKAVRAAVGPDFPILLRLSQWKISDVTARLATTPKELEQWLSPLCDAGVDIFHCSQRRFWEPEFADSDLNFAGWTKKITGKPTVTVGSVGLSNEFFASFSGTGAEPAALDELLRRFDRGDFDLVAVGRALLNDPQWVRKIRLDQKDQLKNFKREDMAELS